MVGGFVAGYNATKYSEKQPQVRGVEAAVISAFLSILAVSA
jgi:hypothetical protein